MKNTREIAKEYRLSHWAGILRERNQSGLSVKAFCRKIGICGNTYFYWQRKLRELASERFALSQEAAPRFTEVKLSVPQKSNPETTEFGQIRIEVGVVQITTDSRYPTEKLAALLRELSRLC